MSVAGLAGLVAPPAVSDEPFGAPFDAVGAGSRLATVGHGAVAFDTAGFAVPAVFAHAWSAFAPPLGPSTSVVWFSHGWESPYFAGSVGAADTGGWLVGCVPAVDDGVTSEPGRVAHDGSAGGVGGPFGLVIVNAGTGVVVRLIAGLALGGVGWRDVLLNRGIVSSLRFASSETIGVGSDSDTGGSGLIGLSSE